MERSGYGYVMKSTMLRDDLGATAKALYAFLCVHADANGECFPSVKSICHYLQIQEDTCYKYLKQLKTAGIIEVTKKRQGTRFANNVYRLADRPYRKKTDMENEPYPEKNDMETGESNTGNNQALENSSSGERDTNIPSFQENHSFNKTKANIYVILGGKLTERRKRAGLTRGKLTDSQIARMYVDGLLKSGFTEKQLLDLADRFPAGKCFDSWWHFEKFCLSERGKR